MQEDDLLLLNNEEEGIDKFEVFGQVVQVVNDNNFLVPRVWRAHGVQHTVLHNNREDLFKQQSQQHSGNSGQHQIVQLEWIVQLPGRQVLEDNLSKGDDEVVQPNNNSNFERCAHERLALNVVELIRHKLTTTDGGHELVEQRPKVDSKRSLYGRNSNLEECRRVRVDIG